MLHELIRHDLDYGKAYEYAKEKLGVGKTLSFQLLELIDSKKGNFFVLLTEEADLERIYEFNYGRIYPVGPLKEVVNRERIYEWYTDGMNDEFVLYLNDKIRRSELNCLFEDIQSSPTDPNEKYQIFFSLYGLSYNDEIFYLVNPDKASNKLIEECLWRSDAQYHQVLVLTKANFVDAQNQQLTLDKIQEACAKTEVVILGAYDGEGYVFWEPKED